MTCISCKGDLINKNTNFIADLGDCIIIVKDVPSQVCSQCGEVSYSHEVAKRLEEIVGQMKNIMTEVAIVPSTRWPTGRSSVRPIMDLREVPRSTGNPRC